MRHGDGQVNHCSAKWILSYTHTIIGFSRSYGLISELSNAAQNAEVITTAQTTTTALSPAHNNMH